MTNSSRKPAGIILSAGYSSRMNDFKPLMEIGGKTPLDILIDHFQMAGIHSLFVVVGHNANDIRDHLKKHPGVRIVMNPDFDRGMFSSIQCGVRAASENGNDCFLLVPVDIPMIPPYIMKAMLNRFYDSDQRSFVVPCYEGKKGHPLLVPECRTEEVLKSAGEHGMKSVTAAYEKQMIRVDTHCRGILLDMDTQEAYREMLNYYHESRWPDEEQCRRILNYVDTPSHIVRHCIAVRDAAVVMAEALNQKGLNLDIGLVRASGMLHDSLRMEPKHGEAGAQLLLNYGYPDVADIILDHMTYVHPLPVESITERDLICLADKLCQEDRHVTLEERFEPVRVRWKDDPEALAAISSKIDAAYAVMDYIESIIGENIYDLIRRFDDKSEQNHPKRHIVLVRHGETEKHREKIFLGQTDVPLSEEGRDQCQLVGIEMQHFPFQIEQVFCSDLKRAKESAEIIVNHMGGNLPIKEMAELREMNLGAWDGMFMSEVREKYADAYEARGRDLLHYRVDGDAENFVDLHDRVTAAYHSIIEQTKGDIMIVSHSGVNRVLKCEITGRPLKDVLKMNFARGSYQIFELPDQE